MSIQGLHPLKSSFEGQLHYAKSCPNSITFKGHSKSTLKMCPTFTLYRGCIATNLCPLQDSKTIHVAAFCSLLKEHWHLLEIQEVILVILCLNQKPKTQFKCEYNVYMEKKKKLFSARKSIRMENKIIFIAWFAILFWFITTDLCRNAKYLFIYWFSTNCWIPKSLLHTVLPGYNNWSFH